MSYVSDIATRLFTEIAFSVNYPEIFVVLADEKKPEKMFQVGCIKRNRHYMLFTERSLEILGRNK